MSAAWLSSPRPTIESGNVLALWGQVWFVNASVSGFQPSRFVAVAARRLAGVLGGALLAFALLAANSELHHAWHHGGNPSSNSCALCLFAKGQVEMPDSTMVFLAAFRPSFDSAPPLETVSKIDLTYLAFPSRAPPAITFLSLAVA